jgi:hypothetical protein
MTKINIDVKHYIDQEIKHSEEKTNIKLNKTSEALTESEKVMDRRLAGMNEFREQLNEQTKTFISREEFFVNERLINSKIEGLSKLVYIGMGIFLVLEIVLGVVLSIVFK